MLNNSKIDKIDSLIHQLAAEKDEWMSLAIAVDLADEIMKGVLPENPEWQEQLNRNVQVTGNLPKPLPVDLFKTQKQNTWFREHPESASARIALQHFKSDNCALESTFYWFSESATKQKISASTELTTNWEDSDLTRKPTYKVGIDFFLTNDANSLLVVLTNHQKLRVMELNGRMSNTQKQIFLNKLNGAAAYDGVKDGVHIPLEPQKTIHTTLWNALQLKEVNKKFYEIIAKFFDELVENLVTVNHKDYENAKQFSSRLLGRLLFIWFLRKMEIINEEIGYFYVNDLSATDYYEKRLKLLFFSTLNIPADNRKHDDKLTPYLNGGLFEAKDNDYATEIIDFPDGFFKRLYTCFEEFNFTTDESSADFELIAVDPEMLGQVFESLLASQVVDGGNNERNRTGSFYTPREIVNYMCKESLRKYLYNNIGNEQLNDGIDQLLDLSDSKFLEKKSTSQADLWGVNSKVTIDKIKQALDEIKILDPACGSGAYPMGMLQLLLKTYERIEKRFDPYKLKLSIIENNIYGVDIQPMAIEISRLRAWLSVIVEESDRKNIHPLPNLEFKFVSANTLINLESGQTNLWSDPDLDNKLTNIRDKYFSARKPENKKKYQEEYYTLTSQGELFDQTDERSRQLRTFDPFKNRSSAEFFDSHYMFGVSEGFDIVIGNPPYIHFEHMEKSMRDFYKALKYKTFAARGDIYALFYEKGIQLLNHGGVLSFITSNKWMRAGYGKVLRNFFIEQTNPLLLLDLGSGIFDSATVDTNIIFVSKDENRRELRASTVNERSLDNMSDYIRQNANRIEYKKDESWGILSPEEQAIKSKIASIGIPLKEWNIKINRGILTGLNEAFIITKEKMDELVSADPKSAEIIRPILRGRDIKKHYYSFENKYLIALFPSKQYDINNYPAIKDWLINGEWVSIKTKGNPPTPLGSGKLRLEQSGEIKSYNGVRFKTRKKTNNEWFEIQDSIAYWDDFSKQKIVWKRVGSRLKFSLDNDAHICLDSTCFAVGEHIPYLAAVMNSSIGNYLLREAPTTGTGDLLISVQAMNPVRVPIPDNDTEKRVINLLINEDYNAIESELQKIYHLTNEEMRIINLSQN